MEWKHTDSLVKKKFQAQQLVNKAMPKVFWDIKGLNPIYFFVWSSLQIYLYIYINRKHTRVRERERAREREKEKERESEIEKESQIEQI